MGNEGLGLEGMRVCFPGLPGGQACSELSSWKLEP